MKQTKTKSKSTEEEIQITATIASDLKNEILEKYKAIQDMSVARSVTEANMKGIAAKRTELKSACQTLIVLMGHDPSRSGVKRILAKLENIIIRRNWSAHDIIDFSKGEKSVD